MLEIKNNISVLYLKLIWVYSANWTAMCQSVENLEQNHHISNHEGKKEFLSEFLFILVTWTQIKLPITNNLVNELILKVVLLHYHSLLPQEFRHKDYPNLTYRRNWNKMEFANHKIINQTSFHHILFLATGISL